MTLPAYLHDVQMEIEGYARAYGLDFFPTVFEVLSYKQMNEVAAYGGFPTRYPHWRFGMDYEQLSKGYEYGLQKIYEMVINNNPAYAYLLEGNSLVDQKTVMAHVYGHVDFFKNNYFFSKTNRRMMDGMANHATRVRRQIERHGIDKVETFIDVCLSLDNLIDPMSQFIPRKAAPKVEADDDDEDEQPPEPGKLPAKQYMDKYINPPEVLERKRKKAKEERDKVKRHPEQPQRDVLLFLIENAPLEKWERDVLEIVRAEAYYFAPQGQTKIMNEGWACVAPWTRVFTAAGLVTMADVVDGADQVVSDGETPRRVTDRNIIRDHETVTVKTRRGLVLTGSNNHRVRLPGGDWRRLDELAVGERVEVSGGQGMWPEREVRLGYSPRRVVSGSLLPAVMSGTSVALQLAEGVSEEQVAPRLSLVRLPDFLDERTAVIAATILADGHVHRAKRENDLSGEDAELLVEALGLTVGPSAREKRIPEAILRSPEPVVRAFLRAYFDCDGHAGKQGVILSTASDALAETTQLLLLNYGILSRRRKLGDGCWHVTVTGASAAKFAKQIGFGLTRKQAALDAYVASHRWEKAERWDDEVVSLERGRGDVYDITVEETHRYAAAGFVNHNSYWHSRIMTEKALRPAEIIDYADANAGVLATAPGQLNPYKLGVELFRHIEDRWNKGRFGKEWNECDDMAVKREWDRRLGIGRQKVFEVRKLYNDVTFIDEFFTMEFCIEQKFYAFNFSERSGNWEIESREFKKVKDKLLFRLTNHGQPFIYVVDGNLENRGELLLRHQHEGVDLKLDHARDTLVALNRVWKRPVNLLTKIDAKGKMLRFDGRDHSEKSAEFPEKM